VTRALKQNIDVGKTQMVVVLVTSKRKDRYDTIKRTCCLELPVPSQVITTRIIEDQKKSRSVISKIALQINCKLGGELWGISIPVSLFFFFHQFIIFFAFGFITQLNLKLKDTMICGIDTYHDSEKKRSSVCAFVATSNNEKTKYFSRATIQETHQELSTNLTLNVRCKFKKSKKKINNFI
jgi:aubergine